MCGVLKVEWKTTCVLKLKHPCRSFVPTPLRPFGAFPELVALQAAGYLLDIVPFKIVTNHS